MIYETCPRGLKNCAMLSNIGADDGTSFICVGYNRKEDRTVQSDRFTHCWKNAAIDNLSHWDKRDFIDTISVMSQALSVDINIAVSKGLTDDQMNDVEFQ